MEDDSETEIKHLSIIYTIILPGDRKSSLDPSCYNNHTLQSFIEKLNLLKSLYLITDKSDQTDMKYKKKHVKDLK